MISASEDSAIRDSFARKEGEMSAAAVTRLVRTDSDGNDQPEQRLHQRYPITLILDYKLLYRGRVQCQGSGRTVNISSGGAFFAAKDFLPGPHLIELAIRWPFRLEGDLPLKLVVRGQIVRNDGQNIAVKFLKHEFRTAACSLF